ncbi:rhodanese-like domain-containing protein [Cochleicola gelatinilyticus]|uniref:Rhodanese n=1 Tax=Cochleicola gelatinilyticus TaxID=1763537 RepID=A0A167KBP0_9FLAO|nr:rhodanese-like domain-containing protein [Cochleicola gelatinilyticus]OAB81699.1 rhodanese [Cochleicola gelatinilyticus]
MADLTQAQWSEQLEADEHAVILDVRTDAEVAEGYIPEAIHMDIFNAGAFMEKAKELDTSKNYYVYCRSGGRSGQACAILNSLGFNNTYNLMGGFSEWNGASTNS